MTTLTDKEQEIVEQFKDKSDDERFEFFKTLSEILNAAEILNVYRAIVNDMQDSLKRAELKKIKEVFDLSNDDNKINMWILLNTERNPIVKEFCNSINEEIDTVLIRKGFRHFKRKADFKLKKEN